MPSLSLKQFLLSATPGFLKPHWQRLEASPLGYRLAKGAFWSLAGALVSRGLALVSTIVVGRLLGPSGYGELGIIQSTVGLFGTVGGLGLGMSSTKYVAECRRADPYRAGRIISLASATAWVSGTLMALVLLLAAPWVARSTLAAPHLTPYLRIGSLLLLLNGVNGAQTGSLSGFEAFKTISKVNLVSGLLSLPLMIGGVLVAGLNGAIWALVITTTANCLLSWQSLRVEARQNEIPLDYKGCTKEWRIFVNFNLPGVLNSVLLSFSAWACGAILVNQTDGYASMGVYNAVKRVQQVPEVLIGMLMSPFLPVLSEAFGRKDMRTYGKTLMAAFSVGITIMVPFSLVQLAAPWLTLLPYGGSFRGGEAVVQWVMVGSIAYGLLWPLGTVVISMGRMWFAFWLIVLNTALFLGLGQLLVPKFGAAGYAAAAAFALVLCNVPSVFFLYSKLGSVMRQVRWGSIAGATCLLAVACWSSGPSATRSVRLLLGISAALAFAAWCISGTRNRASAKTARRAA